MLIAANPKTAGARSRTYHLFYFCDEYNAILIPFVNFIII